MIAIGFGMDVDICDLVSIGIGTGTGTVIDVVIAIGIGVGISVDIGRCLSSGTFLLQGEREETLISNTFVEQSFVLKSTSLQIRRYL